jgi:hypothetical protein
MKSGRLMTVANTRGFWMRANGTENIAPSVEREATTLLRPSPQE